MVLESNKRSAALSSALSRSLEALAFVEILPLGENAPPEVELIELIPRQEVVWAAIPLIQPTKGELVVILSRDLGIMLTDRIYGFLEEEMTEDVLFDAVAELANVITGQFMNTFLQGSKTFELGVPMMGSAPVEGEVRPDLKVLEKLDYAVEGHMLSVVLTGEGLL